MAKVRKTSLEDPEPELIHQSVTDEHRVRFRMSKEGLDYEGSESGLEQVLSHAKEIALLILAFAAVAPIVYLLVRLFSG